MPLPNEAIIFVLSRSAAGRKPARCLTSDDTPSPALQCASFASLGVSPSQQTKAMFMLFLDPGVFALALCWKLRARLGLMPVRSGLSNSK